MSFAFGKSFTSWFFPVVDRGLPEDLSTVDSLVSIFVFGPDSPPSRDQAASGSGAVATINSWTWDSARQGFSYTVPAIDDPDPNSSTSLRTYWLAVNFRLQDTEQVQTVLRSETLERVKGPGQAVYVTDDDLQAYYKAVMGHTTSEQRRQAIALALLNVKAELKAKGFKWAQIHNADELKAAVTLKALAILCLAELQQGNDKFSIKYQEFSKLYEVQIGGLAVLDYDSDGDGTTDAQVKPQTGMILIAR